MADEEIRPEVYYIPENFDDAGGVLGGHFSTRNAIEMVVLCGPLGIVEYKVFFEFLHVGLQFGLITMMFTIVPLAALAAFGIGGESLSIFDLFENGVNSAMWSLLIKWSHMTLHFGLLMAFSTVLHLRGSKELF